MAETLVEGRNEKMVSPSGGKPSWRLAHFLKPSLPTCKELHSQTLLKPTKPEPHSQTLFEPTKPIPQNLKFFTSEVEFNGWRRPITNWAYWVEKLCPTCEPIWRKTSIYEAIMASNVTSRRSYDTLFALAQRWCPKTNSFVFPWGEATITLEDVMVLGGFSDTGDSVLSKCFSRELMEIEKSLVSASLRLSKSKSKKASQRPWMRMWMGKGSEYEHEAFLSLWLSRCVFSSDSVGTINKNVFPIAILLARGTKIALAPAVLANIYRDLRLLKGKMGTLGDQDDKNVKTLILRAPLQLLQIWCWERFPTLSPEPNIITSGQPRSARWHKVKVMRKDDVGLAMDSARKSFRWRPYTLPLNSWSVCAELYPEEAKCVSVGFDDHSGLLSFARWTRVSELSGFDFVELYLPHRVSMQFGLDQDVPMDITPRNDNPEIAWCIYNRPIWGVKLYIPSRLFESAVTTRYLKWWKESNSVKDRVSRLKMKENQNPHIDSCHDSPKRTVELAERFRIKQEKDEAEVLPGFALKGKRVITDHSLDAPRLKRFLASPDGCGTIMESNEVNATPSSPLEMNGVEAENDSDCNKGAMTQLFQLDHTRIAIGKVACSLRQEVSPLSSAGDKVSISEKNSSTKYTASLGPSEGSRRGPDVEEGGESKVGSPVRSPLSTYKEEAGPSLAELDRLQRIVDFLKAANTSQL